MSDVEIKLLSQMTRLDEIRKVYDANVTGVLFEDDRHRVMFDFMMDYWKKSRMEQAPTWLVMETEYPSVPLDTDVEETTHWLCDWMLRRYQVNQGQGIIMRAAKSLAEEQSKADGKPELALQQMWQESYAAAAATAPRTTKTDMADNLQERRERYNQNRDDPNLLGVSFGLAELDDHTRGCRPGELAIIAARLKMGKSWVLANAFVSNHKIGNRPLLYTLEMNLEEMEDRIDCLYSGVSYSRFTKRELSVDEILDLERGREALAQTGSAVLARPERGNRTVKTMLTEARQQGADFLLVDQLSWIDGNQHYTGDRALTQKHGDLIAELKDDGSSASAGKIAMFCAVQHNREAVRRDGTNSGRGGMDNLANSDLIGQTADIGLGLWQNQDMRNSNLMGLDIMGTRRCDSKSWLLNWHLNTRTEIRIAEEYEEQQ